MPSKPVMLLALGAGVVAAGFVDAQGFDGPDTLPEVTTATIAEQPDDTIVKLEGRIVSTSGDERYEFRDGAGSIVLEIDDGLLRDIVVTPQDEVRVWVEVDKDLFDTEYEAERVEKLVP